MDVAGGVLPLRRGAAQQVCHVLAACGACPVDSLAPRPTVCPRSPSAGPAVSHRGASGLEHGVAGTDACRRQRGHVSVDAGRTFPDRRAGAVELRGPAARASRALLQLSAVDDRRWQPVAVAHCDLGVPDAGRHCRPRPPDERATAGGAVLRRNTASGARVLQHLSDAVFVHRRPLSIPGEHRTPRPGGRLVAGVDRNGSAAIGDGGDGCALGRPRRAGGAQRSAAVCLPVTRVTVGRHAGQEPDQHAGPHAAGLCRQAGRRPRAGSGAFPQGPRVSHG